MVSALTRAVRGRPALLRGQRPRLTATALALASMALVGGVEATYANSRGLASETRRAVTAAAPRMAQLPATRTEPGPDIARLRTRTSQTFPAKGGSYELRVAPESINYRDDLGRWQPVENRLEIDGDVVRNGANRYQFTAPRRLSTGGEIKVATDVSWVGFTPRGATGVARVSGSSVTYDDAWPGVSLRYTATGDTVREEMIIKDRASARDFAFALRTPVGTVATEASEGVTVLRDAKGKAQLRLSAAWMVDAAGARAPVASGLSRSASGWSMRIAPDRRWLADPARRWPVRVDPTVVLDGVLGCTVVNDEQEPEQGSYCGEGLLVGEGCTELCRRYRSLVRFDLQSAIPPGAYVEFATLTGVDHATTIGRLTKAWTSAVDWNTTDGTTPWSPLQGWPVGGAGNDYQSIPDLTQLVRDWASGATPNYGFFFANEVSSYGFDPMPIDPVLSIQYAETDDPAGATVEAMVASYQNDMTITTEEALRRISLQGRLNSVYSDLEAAIDESVNGTFWIDDNDSGRIKIGIKNSQPTPPSSATQDAYAILEEHGLQDEVDFVSVAHTWDELVAAQDDLEAALANVRDESDWSAYPEVKFNRLRIQKSNALTAAQSATIDSAAASLPVATHVEVVPADTLIMDPSDACGRRDMDPHNERENWRLACDLPFRAGTALRERDGDMRCTLGFGVRDKVETSQRYVATAGHCLPRTENNDAWNTIPLNVPPNYSVIQIGFARKLWSNDRGYDLGLIQLSTDANQPDDVDQPRISDGAPFGGYIFVPRNPTSQVDNSEPRYAIKHVDYAVAEQRVCTVGANGNVGLRHTVCGRLVSKNKKPEPGSDGRTRLRLGIVKTCDSSASPPVLTQTVRGGFSGGPVFNHGTALGIEVGAYDYVGDTKNACTFVYHGAKDLEREKGVWIITRGS